MSKTIENRNIVFSKTSNKNLSTQLLQFNKLSKFAKEENNLVKFKDFYFKALQFEIATKYIRQHCETKKEKYFS